MSLTEHLDLRGGRVCWLEDDPGALSSEPPEHQVDVAIVGAGIMGAMLAQSLTSAGRSVALLDRRPPARGATAASTALVMWAADTPLITLTQTHGASEAARRWRRVHAAVRDLDARVQDLDLACAWAPRPEVYLAGDLLDPQALRREAEARQAAGLPSDFLEPDAVAQRFGLPPRAAIVSRDAFVVDPVELTLSLLTQARNAGATLSFPVDVASIRESADGVALTLADGRVVQARQAIIAAGYEAPWAFLPNAFKLGSSFAIASAPGQQARWREDALIWEAADPYLYSRATADGRIVIGGADEEFVDPARRNALITEKAARLATGAGELLGGAPLDVDCAWAATFGRSPDGLPAIGRARGHNAIWIASGFGGNGITFASLAASLITAELTGAPDPDAECFSPYRFG